MIIIIIDDFVYDSIGIFRNGEISSSIGGVSYDATVSRCEMRGEFTSDLDAGRKFLASTLANPLKSGQTFRTGRCERENRAVER